MVLKILLGVRRKVGRKKEEHAGIFRSGREENFLRKPVKYFANYLEETVLTKRRKKFRKKKSRYCSYFYTSIMPTNSK